MATVTYIKETRQHLSAMRAVMDYCMREDKTWDEQSGQRLISGINCDGMNSILEFEATKAAHGKMDGINFYQYVQSFKPTENITPKQAHEIALEFAARAWPGAEVLVTTHCDANHVHSHFIINSVNFETGLKLRQDPNTLKFLRLVSDDICMAHGFSVLPKYEGGGKKMSAREWRAAQKGQSWKFRLMYDVSDAMKKSQSKEDFIILMKRKGYEVKWTDERKEITFTCPNGMKCRGSRLHQERFRKENIENEFRLHFPNAETQSSDCHDDSHCGEGRQKSCLNAKTGRSNDLPVMHPTHFSVKNTKRNSAELLHICTGAGAPQKAPFTQGSLRCFHIEKRNQPKHLQFGHWQALGYMVQYD